jgi:hypothetical protein
MVRYVVHVSRAMNAIRVLAKLLNVVLCKEGRGGSKKDSGSDTDT